MNTIRNSKFKLTGGAWQAWFKGYRKSSLPELARQDIANEAIQNLSEGHTGSLPAIDQKFSINSDACFLVYNIVNHNESQLYKGSSVQSLIQCSGKTDALARAGINEINNSNYISLV